MYNELTVSVIIVAAGAGSRFGSEIPKQFCNLGGKPIVQYSIDVFKNNIFVDNIVLVASPNYLALCKQFTNDNVLLTEGGSSRQKSVACGIAAINTSFDLNEGIILVHDAARPFVTNEIINEVIKQTFDHKAATAAAIITDTIKQSFDGEFASKTLSRENLFSIQTPQGFEKQILETAHKLGCAHNSTGYDDCQLVEEYLKINPRLVIVASELKNIKITHASDLNYAKFLLEMLEVDKK